MDLFNHILLFLLSASVIWYFSGLLIDAVDRVARRIGTTGFTAAFFILGFLTSISEISVAVNSSIEGQPQISAGNLIGASFVILMLIVPFLAVAGNGISLKHTFSRRNLLMALTVISLPSLIVLDGRVTRMESAIVLLVYIALVYSIHKSKKGEVVKTLEEVDEDLLHKRRAAMVDVLKIGAGAVFIFVAGHSLVDEAVFFSTALGIPGSLIGLLLLSVGTNVPELVIAIRSIYKKRQEIAFGDYLGSAVANTPIFTSLALVSGSFSVEPSEFLATFLLSAAGFLLFYIFAGTKNAISRQEGWVLLYVYAAFLLAQVWLTVNFTHR